MTIIAGLGCRHGVSAEAIMAALEQATRLSGSRPDRLAVPEFKRLEAGLQRAASVWRLDLQHVDNAALRAEQPRCATRSEAAIRTTGFSCIAEACALAAVGADGRLLLPRIVVGDVTCALAVSRSGA